MDIVCLTLNKKIQTQRGKEYVILQGNTPDGFSLVLLPYFGQSCRIELPRKYLIPGRDVMIFYDDSRPIIAFFRLTPEDQPIWDSDPQMMVEWVPFWNIMAEEDGENSN